LVYFLKYLLTTEGLFEVFVPLSNPHFSEFIMLFMA